MSLASYILDGTPQAVVERYESLPIRASSADFDGFDQNVVVIDTETTGFSQHHDELIQIAAARMDRDTIVDWYITFVNPGKPIPESIVTLTHITDADVAGAPTPEEALANLVEFVGDAKIVAHNSQFDRGFTTKHPAGYPLLNNLWLDSLEMARIALPRMKSHRLIDLVRAFGAPQSTHRADDDVTATCALFRILLAAIEAMPAALVQKIAEMASVEEWPTGEVFKFFASRNVKHSTASDTPGHVEKTHAGSADSMPFSLRALRKERVKPQDYSTKVDAETLASDALDHGGEGIVFPTSQEVEQAFQQNGIVGALYPAYEVRPEQLAMAQAVRNAYATSQNLAVEAGTGVGKSMAYLVPSVMTAYNNDIGIGIATKTNALLDQLVYKELPALAKVLPEASGSPRKQLTYAALKGFSHYPCLLKIDRLTSEGPAQRTINNETYSQAPSLAALLSFIEQTEYDDIDGLKIDYRVLPRRTITTTSHDCLRRKCPYYGLSCFVHGSRRKAESAHIVVTNLSLLFCDLAADGGLLPPLRFWVVDEAHGAEQEARQAFSLSLDGSEIHRLLQRGGTYKRAEPYCKNTLGETLLGKAKAAFDTFAQVADEFVHHFKDLLYFEPGKRSKGYETVELWINDEVRSSQVFETLCSFGRVFYDASEKLVRANQDMVAYLEDNEAAAVVQREIAALTLELRDLLQATERILFHPSESYVYAAKLSRKRDKYDDTLEALLLNVGAHLDETLFARTHSVVFSSATLTVDHTFTAFEEGLGLNTSEASSCTTLMLDSSYDFDHQMTIYVVKDMPEPNDPHYLVKLQDLLIRLHRAQQGSLLTLFTNRKEMETCFDVVQPELKKDDLRLVCQKWGVSVKGLRDDFLTDEHLSLFALKSFWEGFDAPGATLKGVIIPKLPFSKPTDPLSCERAARDDKAWRRYVLPAAVLETKQAAGRLIRKADDYGSLILADKRLLTKSYGKAFLNSMPSKNIRVCTADELVEAIERQEEHSWPTMKDIWPRFSTSDVTFKLKTSLDQTPGGRS